MHVFPRRIRTTLLIVTMLLAAFVAGACQTAPTKGGSTMPYETKLKARLREYHEAMGRKEIEKLYAMSSPTIRRSMSLDDYKKDLRWEQVGAKMAPMEVQADLGRGCNCVDMGGFMRCVLVVDVAINEAGKQPRTERPLEMWEYMGGEWYWGYTGPQSRGRCPGE